MKNTCLLVSSVGNFNKDWSLRHLSSETLNLFSCGIESLINLNQSLIELHQAVEGANLEALLFNLYKKFIMHINTLIGKT